MKPLNMSLAPLVLGLALVPTPSVAQAGSEATDVHLRNDCRLAAQILTTGQPAPHRDWALETIPRCDVSGGPTLALMWADTVEDAQALDDLVLASVQLQDARILAAVQEAVGDEARPLAERLAGLRVLASYIDPRVRVRAEDLAPDPLTRFGLGLQMDHVVTRVGAEPLPPSAPWEILEFLEDLAETDSSEEVRVAAGHIARICKRSGESPPRCL